MKLINIIFSATLTLTLSSMALANPEADGYGSAQNNPPNNDLDVYRGGDDAGAFIDPVAVPNQNLDDSEMLEDQMNPNPTLEYDQQLYD